MIRTISTTWFLIIICSLVIPYKTFAQVAETNVDAESLNIHATPRDTQKQILKSLAEQSSDSLATNFDTRPNNLLTKKQINSVIERFPALLDKHGSILPTGVLSNDEIGSKETNIPENMEVLGQIRINNQSINLILERVELASGEKKWLISRQTIFDLYPLASVTDSPFVNQLLPKILTENIYRGAPVGQWVAIIAVSIFCIIASYFIGSGIRFFVKRHKQNHPTSSKSDFILVLATPLGLIFGVFLFIWLARYLEISILIRQDFSFFTVSILWLALFIFIWSLMDLISSKTEQVFRTNNRAGSLSLIIFLRASIKVILVLFGFIIILDSNGVDVTTGLAALGIGGIALALGAQKAIENVVGSIIIVVDQPFRVGDFCQIGTMKGTIENIGLRSTRIRTLSDTLVTFPNGVLSSEQIENYTMRKKYLLRTTLNLRYETTTDDLQIIIKEAKQTLETYKFIEKNDLRVRFIGYGATSLDIELFAYIKAKTFADFLEKQEQALLSIGHVIESNNSSFAFPSQTLYFTKDTYNKVDNNIKEKNDI